MADNNNTTCNDDLYPTELKFVNGLNACLACPKDEMSDSNNLMPSSNERIKENRGLHRMRIPLITEIQKFSLHDGPGIRTTIFIKGCPLHCPWCHNPETLNPDQEIYFYVNKCTTCGQCVDVCPTGASTLAQTPDKKPTLSIDRNKCIGCLKCVNACPSESLEVVGKSIDMPTIVKQLLADKVFYESSNGGVTISGGEPLAYPEFVYELTRRLKTEENIHVAIETSCFAKWEKIEPLVGLVDLFIVDIKSMSPDKYENIIGGSLQVILFNIEKLINSQSKVRIHLPIIPGFNDNASDFVAYAEYLGQFADKLEGVDLLPYHAYAAGKYSQLGCHYEYQKVPDLSRQQLIPLINALEQKGISSVTLGG